MLEEVQALRHIVVMLAVYRSALVLALELLAEKERCVIL
jgi:hypothetical protein